MIQKFKHDNSRRAGSKLKVAMWSSDIASLYKSGSKYNRSLINAYKGKDSRPVNPFLSVGTYFKKRNATHLKSKSGEFENKLQRKDCCEQHIQQIQCFTVLRWLIVVFHC